MRHRTQTDKHPGEKVDFRDWKTGFDIVQMPDQSATNSNRAAGSA